MTRPIKFRAWDTFDNKMVSPETATDDEFIAVGFHGLPVVVDPDSFKGGKVIGWNVEHRYKLMQYTGLKDKNGVEIYEGDIVDWDEMEWGQEFKELVKWDYETFASRQDSWSEFCEIIGNIHENPDLLDTPTE